MSRRHVVVRISLALVAAVGSRSEAQRPLNLDFAIPNPFGVPGSLGWAFCCAHQSITVAIDTTVRRAGPRSLRISRGDSTAPKYGTGISLNQATTPLAGRRLRFSGWIRTEGLVGGEAGFDVTITSRGAGRTTLPIDIVTHPGASGTAAWRQFTIDTMVDTSVVAVRIRLTATGVGTAWFADLALDVDGKPITTIPVPGRLPTDAEMSWLRETAIPFAGVDAGAPFTDLVPIKTIVGAAHLIALGEATHGTSEFIRMKHRLTEYAVSELGVTMFAMEEDPLVAQRINRYVHGDPGTILDAMHGGYTGWRSKEHLALFEWMRQYNAAGHGQLEIVGIDPVDPQLAIDSVIAFVARVDRDYASFTRAAFADIRAAWSQEDWRRPDSTLALWRGNTAAVLAHMQSRRADYERSRDTAEVSGAIQNANMIYQAARYIVPAEGGALLRTDERLRDSCMAENVKWQMTRGGPGTRAIVSAHNAHVSRNPGRMGGFLDKWYGADMRVIATTTYEGNYSENVAEGRPIAKRRYEPVPLVPGPPTSLEGILHLLGQPRLFVDLRRAATDSAGAFLLDARLFRMSGGMATNWAFNFEPVARWYDALVFIDRTTPLNRIN